MSVITTNLYKLYRKYYSTDSGETWTPLNEYGYFLKEESAAQCMPIEPQYRWVDDGDEFICSGSSGYDKYQQEKEQVSLDSGVTWSDVSPKETRIGSLIEVNSEDCGYIPPTPDYKARLTLTGGTTVDIPWNGSTVLTSGETLQYSASTVSAEISIGVTSISSYAFYYCSNLSSVTIPDSVTSVDKWAFRDCSGLTSVSIGSGVTSLGLAAFLGCYSLSSITIPNSVTSIGNSVFSSCSGLTNVTIPDSVTSLGENVFFSCHSLTSASLGSGVTAINKGTFQACSCLTSVTIGSSVTSIGSQAFYYCESLQSITCYATTEPTLGGGYIFENIPSTGTLYVPSGSNYSTWQLNLPNWTIQYI